MIGSGSTVKSLDHFRRRARWGALALASCLVACGDPGASGTGTGTTTADVITDTAVVDDTAPDTAPDTTAEIADDTAVATEVDTEVVVDSTATLDTDATSADPDTVADTSPDIAADSGVPDDVASDTTGPGPDVVSCPETPCVALGESVCASVSTERLCVADPDTGCLETGVLASCQAGSRCEQAACEGGCTVPEVIVLVDRSASMAGATWTYTRAGIDAFLAARNQHARVGLRFFPSAASCAPDAVPTLALGATLASGVSPVANDSGPLADALTGLDAAFGAATQAEVVIVVSDGSETCATPSAVASAVDALRRRGVEVHAIGVGTTYDEGLLADIASRGSSTELVVAADATTLASALSTIVDGVGACSASLDGAFTVSCDAGICRQQCVPGTLTNIVGTCVLPAVSRWSQPNTTSLRAATFADRVEILARSDSRLRHVVLGASVPPIASLGLNVEVVDTFHANGNWMTWLDDGILSHRGGGSFTAVSTVLWFDLVSIAMRPTGQLLIVENTSAMTTVYAVLDELGDLLGASSVLLDSEEIITYDSFEPTGLNGIFHTIVGPDDVLHVVYSPVNLTGVRVARFDAETLTHLDTSVLIAMSTVADVAIGPDNTLHLVSNDAKYTVVGPSPVLETIPRDADTLLDPQLTILDDGRALVTGSGPTSGLYLALRQPGGWQDFGLVDATAKPGVVDAVVTGDAALHILYATTTNEIVHRRYAGLDAACFPSCSGACGDDGCGGSCGSCGTRACDVDTCLPAVVINEIKPETSPSVKDGFVELYIPAGTDMSRYTIVIQNTFGAYLQAFSLADQTPGYAMLLGPTVRVPGNGVFRIYKDHLLVDAVAFQGTATSSWGEGVVVSAPAVGKSVGRVPNLVDTDDNAADFEVLASPTPGAAN